MMHYSLFRIAVGRMSTVVTSVTIRLGEIIYMSVIPLNVNYSLPTLDCKLLQPGDCTLFGFVFSLV